MKPLLRVHTGITVPTGLLEAVESGSCTGPYVQVAAPPGTRAVTETPLVKHVAATITGVLPVTSTFMLFHDVVTGPWFNRLYVPPSTYALFGPKRLATKPN